MSDVLLPADRDGKLLFNNLEETVQIHGWRVLLGDWLLGIPTEQGRKDVQLEKRRVFWS